MKLKNNFLRLFSFALLFSACVNKPTAYTIQEDGLKRVLTFKGDSSRKNLIKLEVYTKDTIKIEEQNFQQGMLNGPFFISSVDGKLKERGNYEEGKPNGLMQYFDIKGNLILEGNMLNGLKNGIWTKWYDYTQKEEEKNFKNDVLHGLCTYWYIDGNIKREEVYEEGKLVKETNYQ